MEYPEISEKIKKILTHYTIDEIENLKGTVYSIGKRVAHSDKDVVNEEIVTLYKILKLFGEHFNESFDEFKFKIEKPLGKIEKSLNNLPLGTDKTLFIEIGEVIAYSDGYFHPEEEIFIQKLKQEIEINDIFRDDIKDYLFSLGEQAREYLKEYNLGKLKFSNFEKLNLYLLAKAIDEKQNLFIQILDKNQRSEFYLPIIISLTLALYLKNYCDDKYEWKIGDVIENPKKAKYCIEDIDNPTAPGKYTLKDEKENTKTYSNLELGEGYTLVADEVSSSARKSAEYFRKFMEEVFLDAGLPKSSPKKIVVVCEKKDFEDKLDKDYKKKIPYQRVTKSGKYESPSISIDPLLYFVSDYYTFAEHLLNRKEGIEIEAVVFIGKNKYNDDGYRQVNQKLRQKEIKQSIIIGSEPLPKEDKRFLKWNWTIPELLYLTSNKNAEINYKTIPQSSLKNQ